MQNNGLVHVYTGDGRGKTSISLGMIMRGVGAGMKVLFCQFLKGQETSELDSLKKLGVTVVRTGDVKKFIPFMTEIEKKDCKNSHDVCYNKMSDMFFGGEYDMIVLDEIMAAIEMSIIDQSKVVQLIKTKPQKLELVLTGRNAPKEIIDLADYVSDINSIKHPYDIGIPARKGIEY